MINVVINETGAQKTLSILDQNGLDYVKDFIGMFGAFDDGQFVYDDGVDIFTCSQETFTWWSTVVADNQKLQERISELEEVYDSDEVYEVVYQASLVDLENLANSVNNALDEAFPETVALGMKKSEGEA